VWEKMKHHRKTLGEGLFESWRLGELVFERFKCIASVDEEIFAILCLGGWKINQLRIFPNRACLKALK
jgi:hypothetical protein